MERRPGEPRCGKPDGSGCTDAKFLLGRTAEKRKGCISQPEWAGRSLGSLSSAGWQRETSRNSLAGHRQRREILDFWPARGREQISKLVSPASQEVAEGNFKGGDGARSRRYIYTYYTFVCFLISSPLLSFVSATLLTIQSLIPSFSFPTISSLERGDRRVSLSSFFFLHHI